MLIRLVSIALATSGAVFACAPHDVEDAGPGPKTVSPEPEYEPNPFPGPDDVERPQPNPASSVASISSVHVMNDCPPAPAQASAVESSGSRSQPYPGAGVSADFAGGCMGSSMQMAFTAHAAGPGRVVVRSIRMFASTDGKKVLAQPATHQPMSWSDAGGYAPWDLRLAPGKPTQATFQVSGFQWNNVDTRLSKRKAPGSSWGTLFVLEVDVEIDGVVQTVRSPEFTRDDPQMVVT